MSKQEGTTSAHELAQALEEYFADNPSAVVFDGGKVLFDMRVSSYSVKEQLGRCVLQMWSEERNIVRTVTEIVQRTRTMRLVTRRMGVSKPDSLELLPDPDFRPPTTRAIARKQYMARLERAVARRYPDYKPVGFRNAMDMEHSFGPAYVRGTLAKGLQCTAVIGVSAEEQPATIDGVLTLGLLWLHYCREHADGRRLFSSLLVVVPVGMEATTAARMAWLNKQAADWQLYTLDEKAEELAAVDACDIGNKDGRLFQNFNHATAIERAAPGIERAMSYLPDTAHAHVERVAHNPGEVGLHWNGLEFARIRQSYLAGSFTRAVEVTFGTGRNETELTDETAELFQEMTGRLIESRVPGGLHVDPLYRIQPERWLEAQLRARLPEVEPTIRKDCMYSQVPAFSAGDRGTLDLLTCDWKGRLIILEIKAQEDLHLPLQALDYWIRLRGLRGQQGWEELQGAGYFADTTLAPSVPALWFVCPALRVHPANAVVLRYLSPEVEWQLLAVGENWREDLKIVFRKRGPQV